MTNCNLREGAVISIGLDRLRVRLDPEAARDENGGCRSCAMRGWCRGRWSGSGEVTVTVTDMNAAKRCLGERVRLHYVQANPALAAIILFVPALVGLALGAFAAAWLFGGEDKVFLIGAGCGFALGLLVTFAINRLSLSLRPIIKLAEAVIDSPE
ncbi:MAG: SoxR reducing system RseC family protein [Planctomycetes bacterium]|nr:SoxR reducing system RseC family protein [Planctomycetota bacterium]